MVLGMTVNYGGNPKPLGQVEPIAEPGSFIPFKTWG